MIERDPDTHARLVRWGSDALLVLRAWYKLEAHGLRTPRTAAQTARMPAEPSLLAEAPTHLQDGFACVKVGGSLLVLGGREIYEGVDDGAPPSSVVSEVWLLRPHQTHLIPPQESRESAK